MYTAKQPGRNRIALYGDDTERAAQTLVASRETSALFQALATPGMIEMHYQPIHGLPGHKVEYYEALARIRYNGDAHHAGRVPAGRQQPPPGNRIRSGGAASGRSGSVIRQLPPGVGRLDQPVGTEHFAP